MKYIPMRDNCLQWTISFEKYEDLISNHLNKVFNYLNDIINETSSYSNNLKEFFELLPIQSKIRLTINPNVAEILYTIKTQDNPVVLNAMYSQLHELIASQAGKTKNGLSSVTINTLTGAEIDYNGFHHSFNNEKKYPIERSEAIFFSKQINLALNIIKLVSPEAYSLIAIFTNMIHLRGDATRSHYSSWSTHIGIGKICASNFHCIANQIEEVIDFLIHESIHNFLHLLEENYGTFLNDDFFVKESVKAKSVSSPWSGNNVDLGSYTHAICVWFGLANFWQTALLKHYQINQYLEKIQIERMLDQACCGFLESKNVYTPIGDSFKYLDKYFYKFSKKFKGIIANNYKKVHVC